MNGLTTRVRRSRRAWVAIAGAVGAFALAVLFVSGAAQAGGSTIYVTQSMIPLTITTPGKYVLAGDLTGPDFLAAITINASNVDLEGKGNTISAGSQGAGIETFSVSNTVINDVTVSGGAVGFLIESDSGDTLSNDTAENASLGGDGGQGFYVAVGSDITLSGDTATNNVATGIELEGVTNSTVKNSTANDNTVVGVLLIGGGGNSVTGNTADGNGDNCNYGFGIPGGFVIQSDNNIVQKNNANSNTCNEGIAIIAGASGNTIVSNTATGNPIDLTDDVSTCPNGWAGNNFVRDIETGIASGPTYGCIR